MTNFHDPGILASNFRSLDRLNHAMSGLYLWEFFINVNYEWSIVRRRRHHDPWMRWVYMATSRITLQAAIFNIVYLNNSNPSSCQSSTILQFVFGYLAYTLASLLIMFRVFTVWNKSIGVMIFMALVWFTNVSVFIQALTRIHSEWVPLAFSCSTTGLKNNKSAVIAMLSTDVILLLFLIIGVFRTYDRGGSVRDLVGLLWKQGIISLAFATAVAVPSVVFTSLDLNDAFNMMLIFPSLIMMSIIASRMYSSAAESVSITSIDNTADLNTSSEKADSSLKC